MELTTALLGMCVSLFIFLVGQLVTGIWWASRMTTTLTYIQKSLDVLTKSVQFHDANLYNKKDAAADLAKIDHKVDICFKKADDNALAINSLQEKIKK